MRNIGRLFLSDLKCLTGNIVTILTVVGLIALPSIFSWYNILACWNVFDNTGNLTVAVANSDEGYESDLVPLEVNIGEKLVSALRENDQLNWVFTDEENAIDGVSSGRYYAAVVIPPSFSADMMSFYSDEVEHAKITYYSNQKKSAIAPKVTDQGADQISSKVNTAFTETLSEIVLSLSSSLIDYANKSNADDHVGNLASNVKHLATRLADTATALSSCSSVIGSTQMLVNNCASLLEHIGESAEGIAGSAEAAKASARDSVDSMKSALASLSNSLQNSQSDQGELLQNIDDAFVKVDESSRMAEEKLRTAADTASSHKLDTVAEHLVKAANNIQTARDEAQAARARARDYAEQASTDLEALRQELESELEPSITSISGAAEEAHEAISSASAALENAQANSDLSESISTISNLLGDAKGKVDTAASEITASSERLGKLGDDMVAALNSGDIARLRDIIGNDPSVLAEALAAPVKLERVAIYPVDNFGSAMSPLYTTLALWIGALLIMVTLKMRPSERRLEEIGNPTSRQIFMGRFLVVALLSLTQSTLLSVGNLLFLEVQAVNPFLYVLCFWVAGLVFSFIIYTMVALFANLGKALGVILLIIQVAGGGGSFPLQLLPEFFQTMSPYLPIAHAVKAMRAAMFGLYNGDFWMEVGILLLFMVPFALLGLALNGPLSKAVPKFIERVEKSKLM